MPPICLRAFRAAAALRADAATIIADIVAAAAFAYFAMLRLRRC